MYANQREQQMFLSYQFLLAVSIDQEWNSVQFYRNLTQNCIKSYNSGFPKPSFNICMHLTVLTLDIQS